MCLFHSWALDAKTKKLVFLKCKRRKWAMHITAHLRYGCHFLGMALFRTVQSWFLKEMNQALRMIHKRKLLKDQAQQGQQLFLRTIMEFVLLSCQTQIFPLQICFQLKIQLEKRTASTKIRSKPQQRLVRFNSTVCLFGFGFVIQFSPLNVE